MSEIKLTYSKLVQIAREFAQGVLDGRWGVQLIYNSRTASEIYLMRELDYDPLQVFHFGDVNHPWYDKKYRDSAIVEGKFLNGQWNVSSNPVGQQCRDEVARVWELLRRFGYINLENTSYFVAQQAFELLKSSPQVTTFISYKRSESSLLALYLQSRLKIAGGEAFVDVNNLNLGDEWHSELQNKVQSSAYFICLIGPTTLQSEYVRKEIQWAQATNIKMIPVFHNGFDANKEPNKSLIDASEYLAKITQKHGHIIRDSEDPNAYRNAADEILTSLGYAVL